MLSSSDGNGLGNSIWVTDDAVDGDLTIVPANLLNGALVFSASLEAPPGRRLTLAAGTVIKWQSTARKIFVQGALDVAGTEIKGCTPFISVNGAPSTQPGVVFGLQRHDVINQKNGIFFYGINGLTNTPLLGGTFCVKPSLTRTAVLNSGGNIGMHDCSGVYDYDFNQLIQSGSDPALVPGTRVWGQFWYRDPPSPIPSGLSNGVNFTICN